MNPFDMAIGVILGYCMIKGVFRGFIREAAAIAGLLGGFYAALVYHDTLAPAFSGLIHNLHYLYIFSFLVLFCTVFLGVTLLGMLIRALLRLMLLGVLDRVFGSVFGAVKGIVIAALLFFLLATFLPRGGAAMVRDSVLAPHVNFLAGGIARVIPQEARRSLVRRIQELKTEWEQARSETGRPAAPPGRVEGGGNLPE